MNYVVIACEEILSTLERKYNKVDKLLKEIKTQEEADLSKVFITYKEYELYTYEDIQTLYGEGVISSTRFDKLYDELKDKRAMASPKEQIGVYENELRILGNLIANIDYTIRVESKKQEGEK